jgi:hypothetical protein
MAVLDFPNDRDLDALRAPTPDKRAIGTSRQPRRLRGAAGIGKTLLVLMPLALGVLAFRFVLVLAHGFLH